MQTCARELSAVNVCSRTVATVVAHFPIQIVKLALKTNHSLNLCDVLREITRCLDHATTWSYEWLVTQLIRGIRRIGIPVIDRATQIVAIL